MFSFWRKFSRWKPKKEGPYLCIMESGQLMLLHYIHKPDVGKVWLDTRRKSVFNGYKVYKPGRATMEENRVWEDDLCEREDVIFWKKPPRLKTLK